MWGPAHHCTKPRPTSALVTAPSPLCTARSCQPRAHAGAVTRALQFHGAAQVALQPPGFSPGTPSVVFRRKYPSKRQQPLEQGRCAHHPSRGLAACPEGCTFPLENVLSLCSETGTQRAVRGAEDSQRSWARAVTPVEHGHSGVHRRFTLQSSVLGFCLGPGRLFPWKLQERHGEVSRPAKLI